jgi:hypothetical protein
MPPAHHRGRHPVTAYKEAVVTSMKFTPQSRREGRLIARQRLAAFHGHARKARNSAALTVADACVAGCRPHPDHVRAFQLLDRLVQAQVAAHGLMERAA